MAEDDLSGMVPPRHMWAWVGNPDDFLNTGRAFFNYLVDKGQLTASSAVLDVGCGVGKHAIHFTTLLQPPGRYDGFDVEPLGIDWCREAIGTGRPHFNFTHIDLKSDMYHPGGGGDAAELRFPYEDDTFDLVFLGSVFSHMFFPQVENYAEEIVRVLKPGGRMIATGYFIGPYKEQGIAEGTAVFTFPIEYRGSRIESMEPPEGAVAQDRPRFRAMLQSKGFAVEEERNGLWHKLKIQDQDFFIARKLERQPA